MWSALCLPFPARAVAAGRAIVARCDHASTQAESQSRGCGADLADVPPRQYGGDVESLRGRAHGGLVHYRTVARAPQLAPQHVHAADRQVHGGRHGAGREEEQVEELFRDSLRVGHTVKVVRVVAKWNAMCWAHQDRSLPDSQVFRCSVQPRAAHSWTVGVLMSCASQSTGTQAQSVGPCASAVQALEDQKSARGSMHTVNSRVVASRDDVAHNARPTTQQFGNTSLPIHQKRAAACTRLDLD